MLPRPRPQLVEREERGGLVEEVEGLVEKLGGVLVLEGGGEGLFGKFFALGIGGDGDVEVRRVRVAEASL